MSPAYRESEIISGFTTHCFVTSTGGLFHSAVLVGVFVDDLKAALRGHAADRKAESPGADPLRRSPPWTGVQKRASFT
jgi:hypothetical protein